MDPGMTGYPAHVSILIPARNEEELLPACLASVRASVWSLGCAASFDVVVAVDCSSDRTWELAQEGVEGMGIAIQTDAGAVGSARAEAAALALSRFRGPRRHCWLANTDADCVVPPHWLSAQLALAARGIDVVAGTIDVVDFREHAPHVEERFRQTYRITADGTHPHVHGANLGLRASTYLEAGGWNSLTTGEDHDLWRRLCIQNVRRASVNHIRVVTSGRRVGRAPHGFASALAAHNENVA